MKSDDIPERANASQSDLREVNNKLLALQGYPLFQEVDGGEDEISDEVKAALGSR